MLLYHGSNLEIITVNLAKCRPFKDFGRGFYLTTIETQAEQMARRTSRIFSDKPWVTAFEFDEESLSVDAVNIKIFEMPSIDWVIFVLNNRNRNFVDFADNNSNHDNKYDIVIGPVANDDIALQFRLFTSGVIDADALVKGMKYRKLNDQYSFHTEKALLYLTKTGARSYE